MIGIRHCLLASLTLLATPSTAQTYSNCNPLTQGGCPADTALGKSVNVDFTKGASDSFTPSGNPTYDSNGATFAVAKSGDSPQITSKWYIMFGRVEVVLKAAPGAGIVSSFVMQSDTLDEIDWEWLGADSEQVQSNYFGKGLTTTYNRGAFHADSGSQAGFKTYTIDWTANQIVWSINGQTVRVLTQAAAEANQYPQTPMQVKIGAWSGGDASNSQGTIQWAKGPTDYSRGPYKMQVKSVSVTDYSTGTQYKYGGTSGKWQDIVAVGGSVNSGGGSKSGSSAPAITSVSSGQPLPFEGTHRSGSVNTNTNVYPFVAQPTTLQTSASAAYSNYPGLPSGWTVSDSGKVVPGAASSTYLPASSTLLSAVYSQASSSALGDEPTITYQPIATQTPALVSQTVSLSLRPVLSSASSSRYFTFMGTVFNSVAVGAIFLLYIFW